jgi:thiosulfate/3-mercaptopyruvate sulfurtransferase
MFMVPDETTLGNAIGNIGVSNDSIVVVYSTGELCWATRAWWVLRYAGHRNVRVLNGGFGAWQGDLDISIKNYDPASFTTSLSPDMFANINDVETALNDLGTCIVNALPEVIYSGEMETPYSGHIPGTVNHPMHEFMDGQFIRSDDELKTLFADKLDQERLITYCGGGVAATLNASAALLAGVKSVAVYDGSMSEWLSRDKPVMAGIESG